MVVIIMLITIANIFYLPKHKSEISFQKLKFLFHFSPVLCEVKFLNLLPKLSPGIRIFGKTSYLFSSYQMDAGSLFVKFYIGFLKRNLKTLYHICNY